MQDVWPESDVVTHLGESGLVEVRRPDGSSIFIIRQESAKADLRHAGPGPKPDEFEAVNDYQRELEDVYFAWLMALAAALALESDPGERRWIVDVALGILLADLAGLGQRRIPQAAQLSGAESAATSEITRQATAENSVFLEERFLPDVRQTVESILPGDDYEARLREALAARVARVAQYAGTWWRVYNRSVGAVGGPVFWWLDANVENHCATCLTFGNRRYESFEQMIHLTGGAYPAHLTNCDGNCRCVLRAA